MNAISPIYDFSAQNDPDHIALAESILLLQEAERARIRAHRRFANLELQMMAGALGLVRYTHHTDHAHQTAEAMQDAPTVASHKTKR